jgi:hypothetical protein
MKFLKLIILSVLIIAIILIPSINATPITNVAPAPHTTYQSGDSYATVYSPTEIAPPNGTKPPIITITYLANNTVITSNNLTLTFDLTLESPSISHPIILQGVCCKASWQSENITINVDSSDQFINKTLTLSIFLSNITNGAKSITVYASTMYENETGRESKTLPSRGELWDPPFGQYLYIYSNYYFIEGSSTVDFISDTSPPTPTSSPTPLTDSSFNSTFTLSLVAIAILVVSIISLLFYRRHRKLSLKTNPTVREKSIN